jgi:DNA-binding MarR family transcriptional regulator
MKTETIKQAQFIFANMKILRDYFFRTHAGNVTKDMKSDLYGEPTLSQLQVLMVADEHGPVTIKDLAETLGVSSPSVSAMVEKLVEKNILKREHSREDRRKVIVSISPEAAEHIEKIKQTHLRAIVELVEKIGTETASELCKVLKDIKRAVE